MDTYKETQEAAEPFLKSYGINGFLLILVIFLLYTAANKPENFKIYFGFIYGLFAVPFSFLRKRTVRFQIEGPCTKALKKISKEIPELDIPDLSIQWVNEENLETKLREGKAIIKLKFDNDNTRNILKATTIFVKDAFLKHTKPYLHDSLRKALDLIVSKKILLQIKSNQTNLISQFFEENSIESPEVFEKCEKIEEIDDNGLLTRIFLRELNNFGNKLSGRLPKPENKDESDKFLDFLNQIATREYDDSTPLSFVNDTLKVSVILVAKIETYTIHGLEPYLRRIRLGRANGIESFYLMARTEKVEILTKVAEELLQTGNFILMNRPKEFKDRHGRAAICYYIKINEDTLFASSLKEIGDSIKSKQAVRGVITAVREHHLRIDVNGVEGLIKRQNLSVLEIEDARMYFKEGSYVEAVPIEIQQDGVIELTLKNTASDPNNLITSKFRVGTKTFAKISYIDDEFIKVDLGVDKIEGFAYRNDLTKSRFLFLHKKFSIGDEHEFEVLGYNFERASIRLKLVGVVDPWTTTNHFPSETVKFLVCKRSPRSFVGEIEEGLEAILPFGEIGWTPKEIEDCTKNIKLDSVIECKVKKVDREDNIVILALKEHKANPYQKFVEENLNKTVEFQIDDISAYGLNGTILANKLKIYVPKYEMSWGDSSYVYKSGMKKQVVIKDVDKYGTGIVGTFKPLLKHPLEEFSSNFSEGSRIDKLQLHKAYPWGLIYKIKHRGSSYDGILFKSEISNHVWIDDCTPFGKILNNISLEVKKLDFEKNSIHLSLKTLSKRNLSNASKLKYEETYLGFVIGQQKNSTNYSVMISSEMIEGLLETSTTHRIGSEIQVRPTRKNEKEIILVQD